MSLEAYRENISREVPLVLYLPPVCACVSRSSAKPKVEILEPGIFDMTFTTIFYHIQQHLILISTE